jgi:hypothetical protein
MEGDTAETRAPEAPHDLRALAPSRLPTWVFAALGGFLVTTLAVPAFRAGLWDPHELGVIELGRRIAVGLYGGAELALEGSENALPSRGEVGRGELPFTSIGLGLRLFGLHAWAARVALLLWAVAALAATYLLVRRLVGRNAALLAVLVLGTTPLFFLHARTLLGDGVTISALAIASCGLILALFDDASVRVRSGWLVLGSLGLLAGFLSRGLLIGVAVPAVGVALGHAFARVSNIKPRERFSDVASGLLLFGGMTASIAGGGALARGSADPGRYEPLLGFGVVTGVTPPTFDVMIGHLGHSLFPWSAVVPVALARIALAPPGVVGPAWAKEAGLRLCLIVVATLGWGVQSYLAPFSGILPFASVAALAIVVALALHDLDRGAFASPSIGLIAGLLFVVFAFDFVNQPERALAAFGVEGVKFPDSAKERAVPLFVAAALLSAGPFALAVLEPERPDARAFARDDYVGWLRTVRDMWSGNLLFGACVAEASLLGFVAFDLLGERVPAFRRFAAGGEMTRSVSRIGWAVIPLALVLPLVVMALRDAVRFLDRRRAAGRFAAFVPTRGVLAASGGLVAGFSASIALYPALAAQLSPQESFHTFNALAKPGEELGMVGASAAAAPYAAGRTVATFATPERAFDWLMEEEAGRRWLVFKADALGGMNSRYRGRTKPPQNLPILDGRSSEILLASNRLLPGEKNENSLNRFLPSSAPRPAHPLDANLGDQLDVLGWDLFDRNGRPLSAIVPGNTVELVIYYRVVARVTGNWETFVHIDGFQRRFNADHPTLEGRYPFLLWRVGDVVADRYEFRLEPNFSPGEYRLLFGLYSGSRRLPLRRGPGSDDRVDGGPIVVR